MGGKGKQSRGRWRKKRRKRWRGERERKNRYLLLFHGEDLKSEAPSRSGGAGGKLVRTGGQQTRASAGMGWKDAWAAALFGTGIYNGP